MIRAITNRIRSSIRRLKSPKKTAANTHLNDRFQTELELIAGTHHNSCQHPSILHFSFNKAATQYVKSVLARCATHDGMTSVALHDYAFDSNFPFLDHLSAEKMKDYQHVFRPKGYLYSVFGGMIEGIPKLQDYRIVLMTRDPRDILVSGYYSMAFSHPVPGSGGNKQEEFMSLREKATTLTIDDYVLSECGRLLSIFERYKTFLLDRHHHVHVTSYENMTIDFETWLTNLLEYCKLNTSSGFQETLVSENKAKKPKQEDVYQHLRKGQAGDYLEKLKPETINILDKKLRPMLNAFGYS